jgi:hypothetical protein
MAMNTWTIEWAWVPDDSTPSRWEIPTFEDDTAPPMSAERVAVFPPNPGARRSPNSMTDPPAAASTTRDALVAMSVA